MEYWEKLVLLENLVKDGTITLDRGRVISSIDLMKYPGDYPVYSSSAQRNGYFGSFDLFDFDEELITWSVDGGGYFFYRPKHKFSVTNVSGILRIAKSGTFDYKFLYYLLSYQHKNQIFDYVDKAHPSVIRKRYFIPEIGPTEQTTIARILSKVDDAITQTEQLIAKYTRIKTGLMQDLLTKGIDQQGNIRSEQSHEFKDSPLGRIPKEWEVPTIDEIKEFITSGSRGWAKYYSIEGSQFIRITNLKRKQIEIDRTEMKFVKLPVSAEGMRSKLQTGDLLISITADLGIIGIVPDDFGDAFINQHIALVRLNQADIYPDFIGYFLCSQQGQRMFNLLNDGGAKAGLNLKTVGNIPVIKPSKAEQILIVEKIEAVNKTVREFEIQHSKLQSLKTGLMQDLLSGKVRVNCLNQ
jgi:type I restriction enzyme S subunit